MSATIVAITPPDRVEVASSSIEAVRGHLDRVAHLLDGLGSEDPRWHAVGPMTAEIAALARRAVGRDAPRGTSAHVAPVFHQRDLAVAARRLLARDVTIVDAAAAAEVRALSARISVALA